MYFVYFRSRIDYQYLKVDRENNPLLSKEINILSMNLLNISALSSNVSNPLTLDPHDNTVIYQCDEYAVKINIIQHYSVTFYDCQCKHSLFART